MLGVKVNGIFFQTTPGLSTELERKSPFFGINDNITEQSTPVSFQYNEAIELALGFPHQYYTIRKKQSWPAEIYDGERFYSLGTLVITAGRININNVEKGEISGHILIGASDFFKTVQPLKLQDLQLDGERTYAWTTNNPTDGTDGFWQHIHDSWTDNTIPYVFAPIRNEAYLGEDVAFLNGLNALGKIDYNALDNPIAPQIRIKYLYEKVLSEFGWKADFSALDGTDWDLLIMVSLKNIEWYDISSTGPSPVFTPKSEVKFKLNEFLPPDKGIGDFLLQLYYRYGWAPLFDLNNKICRVVPVKDLGVTGAVKDWTKYASPSMLSSFDKNKKRFSLTNEIDSNDELPTTPDSRKQFIVQKTKSYYFLTPASQEFDGKLIYCWLENKWYKSVYEEDVSDYRWHLFADNIYNDEVDKATDTIATTISTLPIYFTLDRTLLGVNYYRMYPMMRQSKFTQFGYRTLLYHGMVYELKDNLEQGLLQYPFASSTRHHPNNVDRSQWSNVYTHWDDTENKGIRKFWWERFLKMIDEGEELEEIIYLPLHELINFQWDDRILIANIQYLVAGIVTPMPYTGFVQAALFRIENVDATEETDDSEEPGGGSTPGTVYAKLYMENHIDQSPNSSYTEWQTADIVIRLYSDIAGTIPHVPVVPINVTVEEVQVHDGIVYNTTSGGYAASLSVTVILSNQFSAGVGTPGNAGVWYNSYAILPGSGYVVI